MILRLVALVLVTLLVPACACTDSYRTHGTSGNGFSSSRTSGGACYGECHNPDKRGRLARCSCTLRCPCRHEGGSE